MFDAVAWAGPPSPGILSKCATGVSVRVRGDYLRAQQELTTGLVAKSAKWSPHVEKEPKQSRGCFNRSSADTLSAELLNPVSLDSCSDAIH